MGPIEISRDSGEIEITARRQRALLAILLLNANRVVATDLLIDRLWGRAAVPGGGDIAPERNPPASRLLGPELIETRAPGYVIQLEPDQLDLERFERLRERGRTDAPVDRARTLREAFDLWHGELLADLALEACVQDEIRRLAGLRLDTLEERIGLHLSCELRLELGRPRDWPDCAASVRSIGMDVRTRS